MTVKDVVVYRSPPTAHVYNVVEHGRWWVNTPIACFRHHFIHHSSESGFSLAEIELSPAWP